MKNKHIEKDFYNYYTEYITRAIDYINKSYAELEKNYRENNLENTLSKQALKKYNLGIYYLTEAEEILSNAEIELNIHREREEEYE